ncbi:MAG TPA: caspase family protein [Thermoanaerobaculia bacterium]|nr:caspase family protein [Thermoanaerobaculia bacterium]
MERRALLIGIDRYPEVPNADLQGCVNDMELMRSLLVERFGFPAANTRALRDGEATRAGVLAALDELAAAVGEDDVVVLFYAGHGSRMADPRQPGRMLESMVTHDSGRGSKPNRDLIDEEIDAWVRRINEKTPYLTLLFDCCHSGSVTRDLFGEATREAEADLRAPAEMFAGGPVPEVLAATRSLGEADAAGRAGWLPGRRRAVMVAACRADELANEHRTFDGTKVVRHGALTFFLGRALAQLEAPATWRDVFEQVAPAITAHYGRQHPQAEGKLDELLFGTGEVRPGSYLRVLPRAGGAVDEVELSGGAAHGVAPGSLWTIRSFATRERDAGEEVAAVRVASVGAATSRGRVEAARSGGKLEPGMRAFLAEQPLPAPGLRVALAVPEERAAEAGRLSGLLDADDLVERVADAAAADVLVRCIAPRAAAAPGDPCPGLGPVAAWTWAAVGRDGRLAAHLREERAAEPADLDALIRDLRGAARYRPLLELANPDPASRLRGHVTLRAARPRGEELAAAAPEPGDGVPVFRGGEAAEFEIANGFDAPVRVSLVEFGCDGKIQLLVPFQGDVDVAGGMELAPGEVKRVGRDYFKLPAGLPLRLPEGFPWAAEPGEAEDLGLVHLKLLVTRCPVDFGFLEQEATRAAGDDHPLERLAALYHSGQGTRSFVPPRVADEPERDWATVTLAIGVRR